MLLARLYSPSVQQNCNRFADKYVEHEFVLVVLDLLLLKPQVHRGYADSNSRPLVPSPMSNAIRSLHTAQR